MAGRCKWPDGMCACYAERTRNVEDGLGRVWMHCESGLSLSKASMSRFMMFCLQQNVEIGTVYAFNPKFRGSLVCASVRLKPEQFAAFEAETGGTLHKPRRIKLNGAA